MNSATKRYTRGKEGWRRIQTLGVSKVVEKRNLRLVGAGYEE